MSEPNWKHLRELTAVGNWDLERGCAIPSDLWWTAKLFYDKVVDTEATSWLTPFVSPGGDGNIYFQWNYGYRKFGIEITDGLWNFSGKDEVFTYRYYDPNGCLPEEAEEALHKFYGRCLKDKWRMFR